MSARKWIGYGLVVAGLLLLFDIWTFIVQGWSPLYIPLEVDPEFNLAVSLLVAGIVVLLSKILLRIVGDYAPGEVGPKTTDLEHESVERRRRNRLPLRPRLPALADRGIVGGAFVLLLLR